MGRGSWLNRLFSVSTDLNILHHIQLLFKDFTVCRNICDNFLRKRTLAAVLFASSGSWNINILAELETLVSIIGKFQVLIFHHLNHNYEEGSLGIWWQIRWITELGDQFITKFGDEFSESPNLVMNLGANFVTDLVTNLSPNLVTNMSPNLSPNSVNHRIRGPIYHQIWWRI